MIKTIMVEKKVFDMDILKVGQEVFYAYRNSYSDIDDWGYSYDCGYGKITYIDDDELIVRYNGHRLNTEVSIAIDDIESGFHKVDIVS